MSSLIALVGESGTGKSTSIENLDPATTFIINVANKPLPFRNFRQKYVPMTNDNPTGNYKVVNKASSILTIMRMVDKRPEIKTLIVEDSSYTTSFEIFDRASESSYTKQVEIASHYASILRLGQELRDDLTIVIVCHPDIEKDHMGEVSLRKIKTYGKMTDKYMSLDGLFTYVLFSGVIWEDEDGNETKEPRYVFDTNDPTKISTAKSPRGVFSTRYIDNDLQHVIEAINEYNG